MIGRVVPVGLLAAYLREVLERDTILADIWVEGEVTTSFQAQSGHLYFTIKDDEAALKCVIFRPLAARMRTLPRPGEQVAVHGRVSLYPRDGAIQLYADMVQPAGLGIAALALAQLRQKLEAEGLFDPSRKRPLPYAPRAIGVVTSADGAVWHDIQHVLRRRYPLTELVLAPAPVQGERAPAGIVAALTAIQAVERVEVVILARGGGSAEDLAPFNDEAVVRAVFACRVPLISAVGHETDWTLVDLAADVRAPTPSAAAEVAVPSLRELSDRLAGLGDRLGRAGRDALAAQRAPLADLAGRLRRRDPAAMVQERRGQVAALRDRLRRQEMATIASARGRLDAQAGVLGVLAPAAVLARGYALLSDAETGAPVARIGQAAPARALIARLGDGRVFTRVERLEPDGVPHGAPSP